MTGGKKEILLFLFTLKVINAFKDKLIAQSPMRSLSEAWIEPAL